MIGLIGILGCVMYAAVVITAVASIVSMAYSIHNANEQADEMDAQNAKNEERMSVQQALADRQAKRSLIKAAQMAATGGIMDKIMSKNLDARSENERRKMHRVGTAPGAIPRPERNYGTVIRNNATVRM